MDDKGFIFTADSALALIVVIVLTTTITSYALIPAYQGQDHQHLEALADSALEVLEQDGTLENVSVKTANGNISGAQQEMHNRLQILIPAGIGYNMTVKDGYTSSDADSRGLLYSTDQVTKVKVISAPNEGWQGRAWYKVNNVTFVNQEINVTTTLWNFHNWLSNFGPWNKDNNALETYYYWGDNAGWYSQNPVNINFSIPSGTIRNAKFLVGSDSYTRGKSFGADFNINGHTIHYNPNDATFIGQRSNDAQQYMYNYLGSVSNSFLSAGDMNYFNLHYTNMSDHRYDMPWFSLIANYTTNLVVPQGIIFNTTYMPDAAGFAVETASNLDGKGGNEYGLSYNLNSGTVTPFTYLRRVNWNDFYNKDPTDINGNSYDNGVPFVLKNANWANGNVDSTLTAVSTIKDVDIPANNSVLDAYVVVNAYGGDDGALVEVWNGTDWQTVFNSFDIDGTEYTGVSDGYGNTPGIIYIPDGYLVPGQNNKVRITTWDGVPGGDYDLVGLTSCYVVTSYSPLNIGWSTVPYDSHQSSGSQETQKKQFIIAPDATLAYLFVGAGIDTKNITIQYDNSHVLYSGTNIPYYLDIASLDASKDYHVITTSNSTGTNYNLKTGTYNLTVAVSSYSDGWESGDANAELFSGTRIAVIYPSLYNEWAEAYSNDSATAKQLAYNNLTAYLTSKVGSYDASKIQTQALWVGNMPNQASIRLTLWKQ